MDADRLVHEMTAKQARHHWRQACLAVISCTSLAASLSDHSLLPLEETHAPCPDIVPFVIMGIVTRLRQPCTRVRHYGTLRHVSEHRSPPCTGISTSISWRG